MLLYKHLLNIRFIINFPRSFPRKSPSEPTVLSCRRVPYVFLAMLIANSAYLLWFHFTKQVSDWLTNLATRCKTSKPAHYSYTPCPSLCLPSLLSLLAFLSCFPHHLANAVGAIVVHVVGVEKSLTYEASCPFLMQTKCISSARQGVGGECDENGGIVSLLDLAGPTGAAAANAQSFLSVLFASCSCTHPHTHSPTHTHTETDKCCAIFVEIAFSTVTDTLRMLLHFICSSKQKRGTLMRFVGTAHVVDKVFR